MTINGSATITMSGTEKRIVDDSDLDSVGRATKRNQFFLLSICWLIGRDFIDKVKFARPVETGIDRYIDLSCCVNHPYTDMVEVG